MTNVIAHIPKDIMDKLEFIASLDAQSRQKFYTLCLENIRAQRVSDLDSLKEDEAPLLPNDKNSVIERIGKLVQKYGQIKLNAMKEKAKVFDFTLEEVIQKQWDIINQTYEKQNHLEP